jgi:hypothetical protein
MAGRRKRKVMKERQHEVEEDVERRRQLSSS